MLKILEKIKKVFKTKHCLACHKDIPFPIKEHKCTGWYVVTGECNVCNPEYGRKHCPACGHELV